MEKTKKSIFNKILVCLSLCLVLLGALAPCFSMTKNEPLRADSYENAYVQFVDSEYWVPYDIVDFGVSFLGDVSLIDYYDFNNSDGSFINSDGYKVFGPDWLGLNIRISFSVDENDNLYLDYPILSASDPFGNGAGGYYYTRDLVRKCSNRLLLSETSGSVIYFEFDYNSNFAIKSYFVYNSLFDCTNVVKIQLYSGSDYSGKYVYFSYFDSNNNNFKIAFFVSENFEYPSRTYYFKNALNLTDNEYYNQGFSAGFSDGYNRGNTDGNIAGYDTGYKAGNTIGYESGYNKGLNDSNQYTFVNLIGATIDAPMQYFKSLFNFELLGVNLSSFLMGLFTLCIIVTIVKLCLGR